ncbi:hypothetical protein EG344_00715 [Chryseobacterium sp. G0162]|uniref:hypothetical protein n=1 Tax=Chryseobacterium sp. G0162 TaxID=2487063 RepID=UPI000F50FC53|nr:hypothetical protein [Chryseobacterium sp. G0162]AZB07464.1 hypothetical protein EG344_00715 [Chryseobacterium sp. G0162]
MILPFSTQINGKPTYFIDKIWIGLSLKHVINARNLEPFFTDYRYKFGKSFDQVERPLADNYFGKLHTIREDKTDRWKEGRMIDFFINNRTKDAFRFAPRIPVISTQIIFFDYFPKIGKLNVIIDGKHLSPERLEILALNDGFENFQEFKEYFKNVVSTGKPKKMKIIHWTNFKY